MLVLLTPTDSYWLQNQDTLHSESTTPYCARSYHRNTHILSCPLFIDWSFVVVMACWKEPNSKNAFVLSWVSTIVTIVFAVTGILYYKVSSRCPVVLVVVVCPKVRCDGIAHIILYYIILRCSAVLCCAVVPCYACCAVVLCCDVFSPPPFGNECSSRYVLRLHRPTDSPPT